MIEHLHQKLSNFKIAIISGSATFYKNYGKHPKQIYLVAFLMIDNSLQSLETTLFLENNICKKKKKKKPLGLLRIPKVPQY